MKLFNRMLKLFLIAYLIFIVSLVHAEDQQDINQMIQNLYKEDVRSLVCVDSRGERDETLEVVSEKYLSLDFMKYYKKNCTGHRELIGDPRTGEQESYSYADSKAGFTNLKIEHPKIKGNHASIRTTYDLPVASYEQYKNFTLFTLSKEDGQWKIDDIELGGHDFDKYNKREPMTGLQVIKSLKQYIRKGVVERESEKKAAVKK